MFRILFAVTLLCSAIHPSFASEKTQLGYLVSSRLNYKTEAGTIETSRKIILPATNNSWTPLTTPKNGVMLIGKLVKAEDDIVQMEYIVVDTRKESAVVSTPTIATRLGKQTEASTENAKTKITISLLATKTTFQTQ